MNITAPKVSVIIPVYNVERYLTDCLDSLLRQTLVDIEIICVNDGSTDGSPDILMRYAKLDSRMIILNQENSGLSSARNAGLDIAQGEYLYFLDSDDYIDANALQILYIKAQEDDLDILFFNGTAIYEDPALEKFFPEVKHYCRRSLRVNDPLSGAELFCTMRENDTYRASVCMQLIKRTYLARTQVKFETGIVHEDELFSFLIMLQAERTGCLADALFFRRVRRDSLMTQKKGALYFTSMHLVFTQLLNFSINNPDLPSATKKNIVLHLKYSIFWSARSYYRKLSPPERTEVREQMNDLEALVFDLLYTRQNLAELSIWKRTVNFCQKNGLKATMREIAKNLRRGNP